MRSASVYVRVCQRDLSTAARTSSTRAVLEGFKQTSTTRKKTQEIAVVSEWERGENQKEEESSSPFHLKLELYHLSPGSEWSWTRRRPPAWRPLQCRRDSGEKPPLASSFSSTPKRYWGMRRKLREGIGRREGEKVIAKMIETLDWAVLEISISLARPSVATI